jgi:hypothetical protein
MQERTSPRRHPLFLNLFLRYPVRSSSEPSLPDLDKEVKILIRTLSNILVLLLTREYLSLLLRTSASVVTAMYPAACLYVELLLFNNSRHRFMRHPTRHTELADARSARYRRKRCSVPHHIPQKSLVSDSSGRNGRVHLVEPNIRN